jgi:dipeptidyl aminopeptidase/acylaminoacyl peptidase
MVLITSRAWSGAKRKAPDERGRLVRSDFLVSATREEVAQGLAAIGWSDVVVKSGISLRRLVYTTIDAHGQPTIASGLLALPTDFQPIGVVSFAHGTDSLKSYVPSAPTGEGEEVAALFASGGFALVAPDYVGLGLSPGPHPYLHVETEARASLDLLTAARRAAHEAEIKLPRSVYITGFSQGGQAALALDRLIETDSDSPWRVAAIARPSQVHTTCRAQSSLAWSTALPATAPHTWPI